MDAREGQDKPVLYWDADCDFCRRWVGRWQSDSGPGVDYRTLQESPPAVRAAAGGEPFRHVVLVRPDGSMATGAAAALEAGAAGGREGRFLHGVYRSFPPFRAVADTAYRWVASHRPLCATLSRIGWGSDVGRPVYDISGYYFPRLIGLIFLFAFLSLWVQIDGLAGSRGILPVAGHLAAVENHFRGTGSLWPAWWQVPSLLWFGAGDTMLHVWLALGTVASLLLICGFFPAFAAFVAWLCYLTFASAVPVFLNFQWDALLLEAGLLVVFYVPWTRRLRPGASAPSRLGRLLVWWLLFRLMFESGIVKLYGFDGTGRNAWLDGTALDFHYFTQPIPVALSWWFAQLPSAFHLLSLAAVFFVELVLPFFIAGPRRLRMAAFWGFTLLMALIILSGHYGFFNLLTLALCVSLVDDACWPSWLRPGACASSSAAPGRVAWPEKIHRRILPVVAVVLLFLTTVQLLIVLRAVSPATAAPWLGPFAPLRSANSYGLFSVMTTERPEITVEASADGVTWLPYRFRYKMEADEAAMPCFLPHMPRLDWQMWFAALEYRAAGQPPGWILPFLGRLQEQSPPVLGLLDRGGAAEVTPKYFRLRLDLLTFTEAGQRAATGRLWQTEGLPACTIEGSLQR